MAVTVEAFAGTESVSTTEHSMTTDTSGPDVDTTEGVFQAFIDLNAMAADDEFEFKVYEKCRTGDTQRLVYRALFVDAQPTPIWVSPAIVLGVGWDMTLEKIAGTDRTINWRISQVS